MKLKKEDHERYVSLEMNLDDLSLLADLLKIETIYQIKKQVALDGQDVENRTNSIINTVSVFQEFDNQIKDLKDAVIEFQAKYKRVKEKPINMMVISVNRAKVYHFLCTKTIELDIPETVSSKFSQIGHRLVVRLEEAIESEPIFDNAKESKVKKVVKPETKEENGTDLIKINMLGQKGQA